MTLKEVFRHSDGFAYRYNLEQANFREVAYILMLANKDPKKPSIAKSKFWPIPELDKADKEKAEGWATAAQALLDYHNKK
jgi:hypothetical protein